MHRCPLLDRVYDSVFALLELLDDVPSTIEN